MGLWHDAIRANIQAWHSYQKAVVGMGISTYASHNLTMLYYAASMGRESAQAFLLPVIWLSSMAIQLCWGWHWFGLADSMNGRQLTKGPMVRTIRRCMILLPAMPLLSWETIWQPGQLLVNCVSWLKQPWHAFDFITELTSLGPWRGYSTVNWPSLRVTGKLQPASLKRQPTTTVD